MKSLFAFMKKEWMEQLRSSQFLILRIIFILFGVRSPCQYSYYEQKTVIVLSKNHVPMRDHTQPTPTNTSNAAISIGP